MNKSIPILQALLIADKIYVDKDTGKHIIAGVFRNIIIRDNARKETSLPGTQPDEAEPQPTGSSKYISVTSDQFVQAGTASAYVSMVGVHGKQGFCLRFVSLKDHSVLFETKFEVNCESPLEVIQLSLALPYLHTNGVGVHALELLCEDEPMGEFRVNVIEAKT